MVQQRRIGFGCMAWLAGGICCTQLLGQAAPESSSGSMIAEGTSSEANEVPRVPGLSGLLRGINAGITISGVHDAAVGWSTIATPAVGYTFNDMLSADVTIPVYMFRLAESRAVKPKPGAQLVNQRGELGDVILSGHVQVPMRWLGYQTTVSVAAPTGDAYYGLTSGRVTYDWSNQLHHEFRWATPSIELGLGDSTTLVNRLVTKDYTSLGPLAHFQAGVEVPLWRSLSFEANAYEQLPIGDQKVYSSTTRRKVTTTVVSGRNVSEDNGFVTVLNIPLDRHSTLTSYYSRSLRFHDDVVSIGITCVLRGARAEQDGADALDVHP